MLSQLDLAEDICHAIAKHGVRAANTRQMNAILKAAGEIVDELSRPHVPATPGMGLAAWTLCDDTGLSSRYMACVLAPLADCQTRVRHAENNRPYDPADFGRCVKLLDAAPELRPHLQALASGHGEAWAALVGAWTELEALYREEVPTGKAPRLYRRMQELLDGKE